jgi:hypothetical protein
MFFLDRGIPYGKFEAVEIYELRTGFDMATIQCCPHHFAV